MDELDNDRGRGLIGVSVAIILYVAAGANPSQGGASGTLLFVSMTIERFWVIQACVLIAFGWLWFRYNQYRQWGHWMQVYGNALLGVVSVAEEHGGMRGYVLKWGEARYGVAVTAAFQDTNGLKGVWYKGTSSGSNPYLGGHTASELPGLRLGAVRYALLHNPSALAYWLPHFCAALAALSVLASWFAAIADAVIG